MVKRLIKTKIYLIYVLVALFSCAYYNTFYNAEQYFKNAIKSLERNKKEGEKLPVSVKRDLDKAIEKANKVIEKYPDSKWVDDAYLLIGKCNYYKGDYFTSRKIFENFLNIYGNSDRVQEARVWLLRSLWGLGEYDLALSESKRFRKTVIGKKYISQILKITGDIYYELGNLDSAIYYYNRIIDISNDNKLCAESQYKIAECYVELKMLDNAIESLNKIYDFSPNKTIRDDIQVLLVKIYTEAGKYDEARNMILEKLADENNKSIWQELELLLAKIYLNEGDKESAYSRFSQITQNYPKTPESAEAYYNMAELNMYYFNRYAEAQKQYEMVPKEYSDSRYAFDSKQKFQLLSRYFNIKNELEKKLKLLNEAKKSNESNSALEGAIGSSDTEKLKAIIMKKTSEQDLADTNLIYREYYEKLYELSEIYYFNFNLPDSAIATLKRIVDNSDIYGISDKTLYTLYYISKDIEDTISAKEFYNRLISEYPESEYTSLLLSGKIRKLGREGEAEDIFRKAEKYFDRQPDSAIVLLKDCFNEYGDTEYGEKSALAIAWLYENRIYDLENTMKWYKIFIDNYGNKKDYASIEKKLEQIVNVYNHFIAKDSTANINNKRSDVNKKIPVEK